MLSAARAPDEPFAVRATALHAAGSLLSSKALVQELTPLMQREREPALRGVAADVLAARAGASGCAAVRAQASRETAPVRGHYAQALQRCAQEP